MFRVFTATALLLACAVPTGHGQGSKSAPIKVAMYKTSTCGCCAKWAAHMQKAGFDVQITDMAQPDLDEFKKANGVPEPVRSCHTALVDGYVVEGHVPIDVVEKMLKERPKAAGIAVPGMPIGSPGMEGPNPQPYDVLTFDKDGKTTVYAKK